MLGTLMTILLSAGFGYAFGRVATPSNTTMLLEGSALVAASGDFLRNAGHEGFAQALYRLSNEMRKAAV